MPRKHERSDFNVRVLYLLGSFWPNIPFSIRTGLPPAGTNFAFRNITYCVPALQSHIICPAKRRLEPLKNGRLQPQPSVFIYSIGLWIRSGQIAASNPPATSRPRQITEKKVLYRFSPRKERLRTDSALHKRAERNPQAMITGKAYRLTG